MKPAALFLLTVAALCAVGCRQEEAPLRSAYYWSTTFEIDSLKENFIRRHQIKRLYVRYFDIVTTDEGSAMPNATIRFGSPVPQDVEVVPTVFITNDCMKRAPADLARKTLRRILQMNDTHGVGDIHEIQMDCDWTRRTRAHYFQFLDTLRTLAHARGIALSATIRLHQLSQTPPPADRGVLMMYNTGDFTDIHCEHPILDMRDAKPYMPRLRSYRLPLAAAYPLYRWRIVFRAGRYVGILHFDGELPLMAADTIVTRQPTLAEIMEAKAAVGRMNARANGEIILFDLNDTNITRFKPDEYEAIYHQ